MGSRLNSLKNSYPVNLESIIVHLPLTFQLRFFSTMDRPALLLDVIVVTITACACCFYFQSAPRPRPSHWKPFNAAHSESLTHLHLPYEVALRLTQFVSLHDRREHLSKKILP